MTRIRDWVAIVLLLAALVLVGLAGMVSSQTTSTSSSTTTTTLYPVDRDIKIYVRPQYGTNSTSTNPTASAGDLTTQGIVVLGALLGLAWIKVGR